jgi:2-polyprenyl-3-methyl-5-hydroxy-6-metoxy-1,4-benzoquinol methylase
MDDPLLDAREHQRALAGLRRVNRLCSTGRHIANAIRKCSNELPHRPIEILDLGCGSGDVAVDVLRHLEPNISSNITGWDMSSLAVADADQQWKRHRLHKSLGPKLHFEQQNIFELGPNQKTFDVIYCCLFLHHFDDEIAVKVLQAMKSLSKHFVIVDDLRRTSLGWWLAKLGCHLLSRSPVVHFDGPQSVRAAFSIDEAFQISRRAGLIEGTMKTHWPQRFLHCWKTSC